MPEIFGLISSRRYYGVVHQGIRTSEHLEDEDMISKINPIKTSTCERDHSIYENGKFTF